MVIRRNFDETKDWKARLVELNTNGEILTAMEQTEAGEVENYKFVFYIVKVVSRSSFM